MSARHLDEADRFVHEATRAFACDRPAPAPPASEEWVGRAARAGVLSAVSSVLSAAGTALPQGARDHRVMHAAVEMAALADARRMGAVLDGAGIAWAMTKGPALSKVVYRVNGAREYSDLDVLIEPAAFGTAVEALVADGAALVGTDWDHVTRHRTAELGLVLPGGTLLDLHWHLVNIGRIRDSFAIDTADLLARRAHRTIGPFELPTLADDDLVLHVLLHAALSGGHRLRWLLDAQQCVRWLPASAKGPLGRRAADLGVGLPARVVLDRAARYLDPAVAGWAEAVQPDSAWSRLTRQVERRWSPSAPSAERSSGQLWLAATRPSSTASVRELARAGAAEIRYRRTPRTPPNRVATHVDDAGLSRWLERVRQQDGG